MKLVIEIPEKTNTCIRSDYETGLKGLRHEDTEKVCDAIYHGTPYNDRPHGEWKETARRVQVDETDECCVFETHFFYSCSVCGAEYGNRKPEYPFCKWCGASMRKEGEQNDRSKT